MKCRLDLRALNEGWSFKSLCRDLSKRICITANRGSPLRTDQGRDSLMPARGKTDMPERRKHIGVSHSLILGRGQREILSGGLMSGSFHSSLAISQTDPNRHMPQGILQKQQAGCCGQHFWLSSTLQITPPCFGKQPDHILKRKSGFYTLPELLLASRQPLHCMELFPQALSG